MGKYTLDDNTCEVVQFVIHREFEDVLDDEGYCALSGRHKMLFIREANKSIGHPAFLWISL